jgi:hypothetical protein
MSTGNPLKGLAVTLICVFTIAPIATLCGKEGMWVPPTLKAREQDMKKMGLDIPLNQLYNDKGTALNNAVVLFGRGCTGEIISCKGLLLTNHHCGYGTVQGLSDTINDYFAKGFFAKSLAEEKPCPGLTVTFIRSIENVTERLIAGVADTLPDKTRDSIIMRRVKALEQEYKTATGFDALVKPYFEGNQYWVALSETFNDIRLVGFPPNGIGSFGGDDENWAWPRHTGDFSVFRVYANERNQAAPYSPTNVPYITDFHFKINTSGYKEGDFTMVYGFPGTTAEYISSYELNQVYSIIDPISIAARTKKLQVWTKHMTADRKVFIQYTSKRAGVANGWKKWQGEVKGLRINNAVAKKQNEERQFQTWAEHQGKNADATTIIPRLKTAAQSIDSLLFHDQHIKEDVYAIELIAQSSAVDNVLRCFRAGLPEAKLKDTLTGMVATWRDFYKNFDAATDKDVFTALMPIYMNACGRHAPLYFLEQYNAFQQKAGAWGETLYKSSLFADEKRLMDVVNNITASDSVVFLNDPAYKLFSAINQLRKDELLKPIEQYRASKRYLNRLYLKARMQKDKNKAFYPDANLTLRVAYGQVKGIDADGPAKYSYQTRLGQAVALYDSSNEWYRVPFKLRMLHQQKNFGRWAVNGDVPLAFLASNHTSGGNSGSPVLNKRGELIGTNFDRIFEGTMSDYLFDPNRCRNITVDIRYTLFIIEQFGDAGWLLDEMDFVK